MNSFAEWMKKVNRIVIAVAGVTVHDLVDQPFREWFDEGMDAEEAAELTLEGNDFYNP
jgi:hypothetical protein